MLFQTPLQKHLKHYSVIKLQLFNLRCLLVNSPMEMNPIYPFAANDNKPYLILLKNHNDTYELREETWLTHLCFGPHEGCADIAELLVPQFVLTVALYFDVRVVLNEKCHC